MENQLKKISVNFDLNQKELWNHGFLKGSELKAYKLIKKYLKKLGYNKRQQSSYQTKGTSKFPDVVFDFKLLNNNLPWFADCVEKITATPENAIFDLTPYIKDLSNQEAMLDFNQPEEKFSSRKAIHFDLSIAEVDKYYTNRAKPYLIIGRVLNKYGWTRQQGSGYITDKEFKTEHRRYLIRRLNDEMPHFSECVKVMDLTFLDQQWDMIPFIKENYDQSLFDVNQPVYNERNNAQQQKNEISNKKKDFVME